jgi:hypothetical protein
VRIRGAVAVVIAVAALAGLGASGGAAAIGPVTCPRAASAPTSAPAGAVQWIFSALGTPAAPSGGTTWSWTRGQGSWSAGSASGAICGEDKGRGRRDVVLSASGTSTLSPQIKRLGLLGVGIVIGVRVRASDDARCAVGTKGTITLFASYYSTHVDTIAMHFGAACADHDHRFSGTIVHVEIDRGGHQVNTA